MHAEKLYRSGDSRAAWISIRELGAAVRRDHVISRIEPILIDAFFRIRQNIELLHTRLPALGYEFKNPQQAFVAATADDARQLAEIEDRFGVLPLSLFMFYKYVGSVDFRQSGASYIRPDDRPNADSGSDDFRDIRYFGEHDPLCIYPLNSIQEQLIATEHRHSAGGTIHRQPVVVREVTLSEDRFHKSVFSGGEDYTAIVPDLCGDFRLWGTFAEQDDPNWEEGEWFLDYLCNTLQGGGFRGQTGTLPHGTAVVASLVDGLLAI